MNYKTSPEVASKRLSEEGKQPFVVLMNHGSMSVEYFAPQKVDTQTPHRQDELYIIISGHGYFNLNSEKMTCKKGDLLFVPAGMDHRFENFSEDFATWVIFYGPDGGEKLKPEKKSTL